MSEWMLQHFGAQGSYFRSHRVNGQWLVLTVDSQYLALLSCCCNIYHNVGAFSQPSSHPAVLVP